MSGLEIIAQTINEVNSANFDSGKIIDYAIFAGGAVALGLLMYYVPKWKKSWQDRDEEKEKIQRKEQDITHSYSH